MGKEGEEGGDFSLVQCLRETDERGRVENVFCSGHLVSQRYTASWGLRMMLLEESIEFGSELRILPCPRHSESRNLP